MGARADLDRNPCIAGENRARCGAVFHSGYRWTVLGAAHSSGPRRSPRPSPERHVSDDGLAYYIEVENSGVFATDPPGAPDSTYAVQDDVFVVCRCPMPGSRFLEGRAIQVVTKPERDRERESALIVAAGRAGIPVFTPIDTEQPIPGRHDPRHVRRTRAGLSTGWRSCSGIGDRRPTPLARNPAVNRIPFAVTAAKH